MAWEIRARQQGGFANSAIRTAGGEFMAKRRRSFTPALRAKVALAPIRGEGMIAVTPGPFSPQLAEESLGGNVVPAVALAADGKGPQRYLDENRMPASPRKELPKRRDGVPVPPEPITHNSLAFSRTRSPVSIFVG